MNQNGVIQLLRQHARQVGGQNELARTIGIDKGQFSSILHGRNKPTRKILNWLGLEIAYLPKQKAKPGSRPADYQFPTEG